MSGEVFFYELATRDGKAGLPKNTPHIDPEPILWPPPPQKKQKENKSMIYPPEV